jgi:uncharacterized protein involved in response to NO
MSTVPQTLPIHGVPEGAIQTAPVPTWRREPYRALFPLGVLLAWAGVAPWLLLGAFGVGSHVGVFHSIAQIQGFLMCFVVGFLFTAVPKRTQTPPPNPLEMTIALAKPVATTVAAWLGAIALAQACWGILMLTLFAFIVRRFRMTRRSGKAHRRPPNSFVWLPLALLIGIGGAAMIGVQRQLGPEWFWVHELGKGLVLQGMILALIIGVGGMVLPLITCGDAPPDGESTPRDMKVRAAHVLAAAVLVGTFVVEVRVSPRLGLGLRCALVTLLLVGVAKIWRLPRVPGWHRWLVWLSAWMLPAGYALAAFAPLRKQAGLHVVFIGGFALMVFAVSTHVSLAHGGYQRLVRGRPWQIPLIGGFLLLAVVARALMHFVPESYATSMGVAAFAFLTATVFWILLVVPRLLRSPTPEEQTS